MPTTAREAWSAGLTSVVMFRLSAFILLVNVGAGHGWRGLARLMAALGISASWTVGPVLVAFAAGVDIGTGASVVATLSVLSWLTVVVFGAAWAATVRHVHWGDNLLSARLQREVADWLRLLYRRQWSGWLVIPSGIVVARVIGGPELDQGLGLHTMLGVYTVLMSSVVFGTLGYFVALLPGIATKVTRAPSTEVLIHDLDPSSTPGVRLVSEIMMIGSLLLLLALIAFSTAPLLFGIDTTSSPFAAWSPVLVGVIVVALVRVALYPTLQLHWWLLRRKSERLDSLNERIVALDESLQRLPFFTRARRTQRMELVQEYFLVAGTENSPFRASSVIQFSAAVVGAVIAFGLTIALGTDATR